MRQAQPSKVIGVLGAGQLALFLNIKAQELGFKLLTLHPSNKTPAGLISSYPQSKTNADASLDSAPHPSWIQGDPRNQKDLRQFLKKVDILTFESEFFSAELIQKAKKQTVLIRPSLKNLKNMQDRWLQKKLLVQHGFPVLDFTARDNIIKTDSSACKKAPAPKAEKIRAKQKAFSLSKAEKIRFKQESEKICVSLNKGEKRAALLDIWEKWGPFVLKKRQGGYDGCGTFIFKSRQDISKLKIPAGSFILEPFISFERELALLSARNQKGQVVFFPLVESFQKNSVCLWVKGPVKHKMLTPLKKQIKAFLTKIDYRGVIAFELFEVDSRLIVNELAPRVHNSCHYSLSALTEDQFSMHLKAISNQDLPPPRLKTQGFAMLNLLGEGAPRPRFKRHNLLEQKERLKKQGVHLYWYGKTESRPGRKMGHLNCIEGDQALKKLLKIKKHIKV